MNTILIFGGSFDPPHWGHINTALAVQQVFHFQRFIFLPCKTPVLKQANIATATQRLMMLKLALTDHAEFEIDEREINRPTPSYMVHTLESYRAELGENAAITLLLGMDAFIQLPKWYQWERLLSLAHVLTLNRAHTPASRFSLPLHNLLLTCGTGNKEDLLQQSHGKIFCYDAGNYPISSTQLRNKVHAGDSIESYAPAAVIQYIKDQALYQQGYCLDR